MVPSLIPEGHITRKTEGRESNPERPAVGLRIIKHIFPLSISDSAPSSQRRIELSGDDASR